MLIPTTLLNAALLLVLSTGRAHAAMPLEQIVGGLDNFRDMAKQLQPAASGLRASPVALLRGGNMGKLQQCADGFAQALQLGGGFVQALDGTPALEDDSENWAGRIAEAYSDCAQSHSLLMRTVANAASGVGYGTPHGNSLVHTMGGLGAVISGLTVHLVAIVGPDSEAAQQLETNKARLLNGAARVKACYSGVLGVAQCTLLGLEGY